MYDLPFSITVAFLVTVHSLPKLVFYEPFFRLVFTGRFGCNFYPRVLRYSAGTPITMLLILMSAFSPDLSRHVI